MWENDLLGAFDEWTALVDGTDSVYDPCNPYAT
jgi:hypothetical protein